MRFSPPVHRERESVEEREGEGGKRGNRTPDATVELARPARLNRRCPMLVVPLREAHGARRPVRVGRPRDGAHGLLHRGGRRAEDELRGVRRRECRGEGRGGAGEPRGEGETPPGADALPEEEADERVVDPPRQRRLDLLAAGARNLAGSVGCSSAQGSQREERKERTSAAARCSCSAPSAPAQ